MAFVSRWPGSLVVSRRCRGRTGAIWLEEEQALGEDDADPEEIEGGEDTRPRYKQRVVPYVQDSRNVLVVRPTTPLDRPA